VTTALYRRYRPETFAEVIGQDHVTAPLRQALRTGQVNHAYLFSGPRGCGKTTSARILARILNCAQNTEASPTDTPCGVCESCVELARGGPGSLDVVEIDAASHGGVDDARELRERATFAPARDRFKIFILDEAHMVSNQGFNALLKIVEEPPPHVKFIFATTEPDKVIGTIRSRTHHYPFRLVPPDVLVPYLEQLCASEGVQVGPGVLPLVVRAGGGSVRDTLSVLDQLIAGAGDGGIQYDGAAALLGYTQASLLDDLVEAIAARDGASAFRVVERIIATGHEPRRFVEDLLERLRDLIVISASGDAADAVLRHVPADQLEAMRQQARHLGPAELSRSADLANAALTEMTGATSPRLHLELLMARLLLPAVDDSRTGLGARIDRLERGIPAGAGSWSAAPAVAAHAEPTFERAVPVANAPVEPVPVAPVPVASAPPAPAPVPALPVPPVPVAPPAAVTESRADEPVEADAEVAAEPAPEPSAPLAPASDASEATAVAPPAPEPAAPVAPAAGLGQTEVLRRRWPEVLETVKGLRRVTWALVGPNAQVAELDSTTLRLAFGNANLANTFRGSGHADVVARAVRETLGFDVRVDAVVGDPGASSTPGGGERPAPGPAVDAPAGGAPERASRPAGPAVPDAPRPASGAGRDAARGAAADDGWQAPPPDDAPPWDDEPPLAEPPDDDPGQPAGPSASLSDAPARGAAPAGPSARELGMARAAREAGASASRAASFAEDEPSPDDPDIASSGLVGAPLIAQMLGGTVIDEQLDEPQA
jgi:DNA polymerase III subunit gamma/tau